MNIRGRELVLVGAIILLALALRKVLLPVQTYDYMNYLSHWYDFIKDHGVHSFRYPFANYNEAYLYLLFIATHLPFLKITNIKVISIGFDLVLASGVFVLVRYQYPQGRVPIFAALLVLLLPTIFLNSALWGQCDSIFTAFLVWGLACLIRHRNGWACLCFGIALSFKLQAIFLFPLLLVLWLTKMLQIRALVWIPLVFMLSLVPALLLGAHPSYLLSIYITQTGLNNKLTMDAPTLFALIPDVGSQLALWRKAAVFLAASVILLLSYVVTTGKRGIDTPMIVRLALVFSLLVPFFLPGMHERYFYLADSLSVVYAFYFPRYFYVPIVVQLCSLESYLPFLLGKWVIALPLLALLFLGVITLTTWDIIKACCLLPLVEDRNATEPEGAISRRTPPYAD